MDTSEAAQGQGKAMWGSHPENSSSALLCVLSQSFMYIFFLKDCTIDLETTAFFIHPHKKLVGHRGRGMITHLLQRRNLDRLTVSTREEGASQLLSPECKSGVFTTTTGSGSSLTS